MKEIFKPIPDYPNYEVSNFGRVKSLERVVKNRFSYKTVKEKILKQNPDKNGYLQLKLCKNGICKTQKVHQLVTMAFLNHKPNGLTLVVDHIDADVANNKLSNLQVITHRENLSKDKKDVGIRFKSGKWESSIAKEGKFIYLGRFNHKIIAHLAYRKAVKNLHLFDGNNAKFRKFINENY